MSPTPLPILASLYPHKWYRILYKDPNNDNKPTEGVLYSITCAACGLDFTDTDIYKDMSEVESDKHPIVPGFCFLEFIDEDKNDITFYGRSVNGKK